MDDDINRAVGSNPFELVVVASLRAKQLIRGCTPRVASAHKLTTTARLEVSAGKVLFSILPPDPLARR